jgi:hypothetical protein
MQKQYEIEERRSNYKKFDFEGYVDRDRESMPSEYQFDLTRN